MHLLEAAKRRVASDFRCDAVVSRAGTGVTYLYVEASDPVAWVKRARNLLAPLGARAVVEYAPGPAMAPDDRWGPPGDDLPMMRELKRTFDPNAILYPGTFVGGL